MPHKAIDRENDVVTYNPGGDCANEIDLEGAARRPVLGDDRLSNLEECGGSSAERARIRGTVGRLCIRSIQRSWHHLARTSSPRALSRPCWRVCERCS